MVVEHIVRYNEGVLGLNGAAMVDTGIFTGRSPKDKYFVEENFSKDNLWSQRLFLGYGFGLDCFTYISLTNYAVFWN